MIHRFYDATPHIYVEKLCSEFNVKIGVNFYLNNLITPYSLTLLHT